jgi:hypothetical protein
MPHMRSSIVMVSVVFAALTLAPCRSESGAASPIARTSKGAPKRADGYWALKNIGGGGTVIGTHHLCVGGTSEERGSVFDQIALNVNCSRYDFKEPDAGWDFHFVCGKAPMVSESKGKISGDFAKSYKVEMTVTEDGLTLSRTVEASNGGPCPAGVTPGDLMDEKGSKVTNILN